MTQRTLHRAARASLLAAALAAAAPAVAGEFRVTLPGHPAGTFAAEEYFDGFGCTGANRSPEIVWSGAPAETRSLVVTVYDPDAPTGSGWWHWIVADLPPTTTRLAAGTGTPSRALPPGAVEIRTDFGRTGWGGPCPPVGEVHRYVVTVTALKVDRLPLPADPTAALVGYMTRANAIASASTTLLAGR
ncbi:MAG: YbhB/YbcL family Raf kinase inhibitor-like protein [Siculibacillus sp.]